MEEIRIESFGGRICPTSDLYSVNTSVNNISCILKKGINVLLGDIDSGGWCLSYAMSMFDKGNENRILYCDDARFYVDEKEFSIKQFVDYCCYIDLCNPMFHSGDTVDDMIKNAIGANDSVDLTVETVKQLFHLTEERCGRRVSYTGNERLRFMAAIGYACGKKVFCFPWLSGRMFAYYFGYLEDIMNTLDQLGCIAVLPTNVDPVEISGRFAGWHIYRLGREFHL